MYQKKQEAEYYKISKEFLSKEVSIDQIELLKDTLRYHEWKYSIKNSPVLADKEYDLLFKKLEKLEQANPQFITADSPTQRVSNDLNSDFPSIKHIVPMLSLDNSYNSEDLRKFDEQIRKLANIPEGTSIEYCLEPKFDGGSVAVTYENDVFAKAATRGNGTEGEDITSNIKTLPSVPLKAAFSDYDISIAELRGEAVIPIKKFKVLNQKRLENGLQEFANPRNSAAGGLRMKKPSETKARGIEVFIFQLGYAIDQQGNDLLKQINKHSDQLQILTNLGFKLEDPSDLVCKNIEEVIQKIKIWEDKRDNYPYEIDGMVIKVNDRAIQILCGSTQHHPRWAIAYKFKAKQATTTLENIEYQVGKIGSITPVAKVTPTQLAGVTVSSISLHNEEFISSKDLRLGDKIIIERAGDVIPYIVKALPELRDGEEQVIQFPTFCPINTREEVPLIKAEGEAAWRCPNCTCGAQNLQKIIFHVSKPAMNIDGFGKSIVERFYDLGLISDISDVYNLDFDRVKHLEGFGQKSVDNLQDSIDTAKSNPLHRLLHSLSIHHLGKKASKLLSAEIKDIFELKDWDLDQFLSIKDIGPVVAENVIEFFQNDNNIALLRKLESYGVNISQLEEDRPIIVDESAALFGKTILFTGSLQQMTRNEAKKLAEEQGAKNISAVSSNLDILVVGEKAGSKLKKAQALGTVNIMTEEEFLSLLQA